MCFHDDKAHDCFREHVTVGGRDYAVTHCTEDRSRVEVEADGIGVNGSGEVVGRWDGRTFLIDLPDEVKTAIQQRLVAARR